jgi:hypothetical protein
MIPIEGKGWQEVRARKPWACDRCSAAIGARDGYARQITVYEDGNWEVRRICLKCAKVLHGENLKREASE